MTIDSSTSNLGQGAISAGAALNKQVDHLFEKFDQDQLGELNLTEALESGAPDESIFRVADADGSGGVSKDELLQFIDSTEVVLSHRNGAVAELPAAIQSADSPLIDQLLAAQSSNDQASLVELLEKLLNQDNPEHAVHQNDTGNLLDTLV